MTTQPEALRLADALTADDFGPLTNESAAELRRLNDVETEYNTMRLLVASYEADNKRLDALNQEMLEMLKRMLGSDKVIAAATDEELQNAVNDQTADLVVREQAAAVLQSRAIIAKAEAK